MYSSVNILKEVSQNFIDGSYEINTNRAFPNVKDGLKVGQRACLWEMWTKKYLSSKPHVKSAKVSGGVIATWHPHGDAAIYETFVKMSQPFSNNIPTVDFHGANGNIILGGDSYAASRYTEVRLPKVVEEGMFCGINKNAVDMIYNFSEDELWPEVFPSFFPNLLVNGTEGIGVSIANTWLPHNFKETTDVIVEYINNGKISEDTLKNYCPDFPTGGTIINKDDAYTINTTGRGKVIIEASYKINGNEIIFYEMPFQVYIEPIIEKIKECVDSEKITGIKEVQNKSDKKRICLSVICKSKNEEDVKLVLNQLFDNTDLRKQYNANQNAIITKVPILLNLTQVIEEYVKHNLKCIGREFAFDKEKAKKRLHILDGLEIAVNNIDEVIEIIRNDRMPKETLMITFDLDEEQVQAILDMKLGKLSKLEIDNLKKESQEKNNIIKECDKVLSDDNEKKNILIDRLKSLTNKFNNGDRKSKLEQKVISKKTKASSGKVEFVPEPVVVDVTNLGYVKNVPITSYRNKNQSSSLMVTKTDTSDMLLLFSNRGNLFRINVKNIKQCGPQDKGTALGSILKLKDDEKIIFAALSNEHEFCDGLLFTTSFGNVKKSLFNEFCGTTQNLSGTPYIKLKDKDSVVFIGYILDSYSVLLTTKTHKICFNIDEISYQGKIASGVKGISLDKDDMVVECSVGEHKNKKQKRGGKGFKI